MPLDQILLILLALALVANAFLLATLPLGGRSRRAIPGATAVAEPAELTSPSILKKPLSDDEQIARAIEGFVRDVSPNPAAGQAGSSANPGSSPGAGTLADTFDMVRSQRSTADAAPEDVASRPPETDLSTGVPVMDGELGFLDHASWDRAVREESARFARFGRPVTVVALELSGLSRLANGLGPEVAGRVSRDVAEVLVAQARSADRIAQLDSARFGVLLLETDASAASAYIDRVRAAVDGWLDSAGLAVGLAVGSATPDETGDMAAAVALAEQRMHAGDGRPQAVRSTSD